jgi:type I restriction enzyme M protein
MFYTVTLPATLWFFDKAKTDDRILFIDARKMGTLIDRVHKELSDAEIDQIAATYHAWRGEPLTPSTLAGEGGGEGYSDIPGFCKSATTEEIRSHGYVLTPGRYVGAEEVEDDGEPFAEKMKRLTAQLQGQMAEGRKLDAAIEASLKELGYGS